MKRLLIIGLLVVMFFILGCGNKPAYVPCCVNVSDTITCYYGEDHFTVDPANCTGEGVNMTCNATNIDINGTLMNFTNMRACNTGKENPCVHHGCYAMVCGESYYDPREDPSYCMLVKNQTITPNTNAPTGLYGSKCAFYELDEITQKKLNKGAWVNSFRAGVGENYDDFEEAKWYFPITDRLTYANPSGFVDRYANYLPGRQSPWFHKKEDFVNIIKFQTGAGLCELNTSLNAYVCALEPDIKVYLDAYHGAKGTAQAWCNHLCFHMTQNNVSKCTADVPEGWRAPWLATSYIYYPGGINDYPDFNTTIPEYSFTLPYLYRNYTGFEYVEFWAWGYENELEKGMVRTSIGVGDDGDPYYENTSGWTDGKGTPHIGMPFECLKHSDCISGHCTWNEYKRFSCVDKNTGKEIDCGIELDYEDKPVFRTIQTYVRWHKYNDWEDTEEDVVGGLANGDTTLVSQGCPPRESGGGCDDITTVDVDEPLVPGSSGVVEFRTNEDPHNLKFIKACNMTEGTDYDYEVISYDHKDWIDDPHEGNMWAEVCYNLIPYWWQCRDWLDNEWDSSDYCSFPSNYVAGNCDLIPHSTHICDADTNTGGWCSSTSPIWAGCHPYSGDLTVCSICNRHSCKMYANTYCKVYDNILNSYVPGSYEKESGQCDGWQDVHGRFARYKVIIHSFGRCEMENKSIEGEDKTDDKPFSIGPHTTPIVWDFIKCRKIFLPSIMKI